MSSASSLSGLHRNSSSRNGIATQKNAGDDDWLANLGCFFEMFIPQTSATSLQNEEMEEVKYYAEAQTRELEVVKSGAAKAAAELDQIAEDLQTSMSLVSGISQNIGVVLSVRGICALQRRGKTRERSAHRHAIHSFVRGYRPRG
jgi:hypothetical protein